MPKKYIDEECFKDFKQNFHTLIKTFNHEIGDLKKSSAKTANATEKMAISVAKIQGKLEIQSKLVWWILGIISFIVGTALLSTI